MVKIGNLSKEIVDAFNLNYEEGTEIKLTRGRKRHMSKHREELLYSYLNLESTKTNA